QSKINRPKYSERSNFVQFFFKFRCFYSFAKQTKAAVSTKNLQDCSHIFVSIFLIDHQYLLVLKGIIALLCSLSNVLPSFPGIRTAFFLLLWKQKFTCLRSLCHSIYPLPDFLLL